MSSSNSGSRRDTLPPLDRPLERPKDPNSIYATRPPSSNSVRSNSNPPPPPPGPTQQQHESFTSKRELKPTFSTNIVRTPGHYQSHASRNSVDGHLSEQLERLSTSTTNSAIPLTRHSSMPHSLSIAPTSSSSSLSGVGHYVEEPASLLSPLVFTNTPKPTSRPIERHSSVPVVGASSLSSIPEISPGSSRRPHSQTPSRSSSRPSSQNVSPAGSSGGGRHHTPPTSSRLSNPLPHPPVDMHYNITLNALNKTSSPIPYRGRVRKGFWNRRGDHLTSTGEIVYAPPDRASPPDLTGYPGENEGYMDEHGNFVAWRERPELKESLPRHGQPPISPYDSVSVVLC